MERAPEGIEAEWAVRIGVVVTLVVGGLVDVAAIIQGIVLVVSLIAGSAADGNWD
jgi:hypothetical protein